MERRLAAILCADIAGYSRMMGADEAGTHASFKAHRSAIYPIILNHGGRIVKNTGDGFLLEFPSIIGAIEAAVAMQTLMAERNEHLPADRAMHFRMGVHMGDVMADEDEVFGDDVNIAVRLETVAAPGGIAVSEKARTEAGRRLAVTLIDAGPHRFKNIAEPINVWTWSPAGSEIQEKPPQEGPHLPGQYRTAIVGVLPFDNLSGSADEYFSDGLTEDLIHALSLQSFYRVLSRNSTFAYKGKNVSTRLIAREIDATYLIQGSVRRAGNKIRVTAELIAPEKGEQLWTGRYDRDMGDLFAMQDEITANLSAAVAQEIYRAEASAPARSPNSELTAWDRFLKGLSHYYQQTKDDFETAIALFKEAIELDPGLSIARAYLALIQIQGVQFGWIQSTRELWASSVSLAESSVRLDPRSSFAFSLLAYLHAMQGHYEAAMDAIKRAIELNPYDMGARGVLGICHMVVGDHRKAVELFSTAVQRGNSDPRYQWAALNAFSHYLLGQYDASLSWSREALYLNPNHLQGLAIRAAALAQLGRSNEATEAAEALLGNYPTLTVERHLRNFHWKNPADIAHYREGLLKAGVPFGKLALVAPSSRFAVDS
ncbi:tetratricopeptide repeat protein [Bradyrhizobium sp. ISRA443]|uniref:adenylate/guanylate cyclase domain-containing protein n=1 Tax=unclassified Bradyrhizobium TaxID=2631580 RepID=UPI00247ADB79|nr:MULTISPECIES: tetratricopeptide repeat protein [unclassified Bradyrhizobium]WGR95400.1 tetratricopeptide repeat protein [Bradyrhizobium sp. ISRA435]WGS00408.1 tetratricopeptide repeat protein [Bradyrhizobium sp. ISRA436]WGS07298.1 tetratricopeptide repeat protein [Bradyrhizobium sp. ISRA437]WGS14182.1 tetratricopeptide repeat protein [Bradyrhizobium sp. ISRA443]